jgi:hypothetical protein
MNVQWNTACLLVACLLMACLAAGCSSGSGPPSMPPSPTPLTLAEWRELPVVEKYDDATFSRLKMNDDKLNSERAWNRFMVETIIPERKKDLPDDFKGL